MQRIVKASDGKFYKFNQSTNNIRTDLLLFYDMLEEKGLKIVKVVK